MCELKGSAASRKQVINFGTRTTRSASTEVKLVGMYACLLKLLCGATWGVPRCCAATVGRKRGAPLDVFQQRVPPERTDWTQISHTGEALLYGGRHDRGQDIRGRGHRSTVHRAKHPFGRVYRSLDRLRYGVAQQSPTTSAKPQGSPSGRHPESWFLVFRFYSKCHLSAFWIVQVIIAFYYWHVHLFLPGKSTDRYTGARHPASTLCGSAGLGGRSSKPQHVNCLSLLPWLHTGRGFALWWDLHPAAIVEVIIFTVRHTLMMGAQSLFEHTL